LGTKLFQGEKNKLKENQKNKTRKTMPNYVLQEMSEEMGDGKKKVYPRMQTYSLHDFNTVVRHMHEYGGSFSEGTIRGVLDTLVTTMKSWMPLGHSIKIDGLGVFSLTLGFDTSTPSEAAAAKKQKSGNADYEPKNKYRHV
jgi:predicted histone-like DNA-binding protein